MALKTAKLSALRKALLDARDLGKHRSMAELQVELGLSRRTLVRYLNDLRAQGDQVKSVRGKGWTMVKPRRDGTLESQIPEQLLVVLRKLGWALRGTPWHEEMEALFGAELKRYPNATEVIWCQDEPQNQGAWFYVQHYVHENMVDGQKLGYAGRPASASPAVTGWPPWRGTTSSIARRTSASRAAATSATR